MSLINHTSLTPQQMAQFENAIAANAKHAADIDYIAMMTDVELPEPEPTSAEEE